MNQLISFVGKFLPKYNRLQENDEQTIKFKNVFVKNFQEELNDESLFNLFSKFGEITSAKVSQKSNG
jgi:polyadenylate-binding protein